MLQKVATADTILMRRPPSNFLRRGFTLIELWVVMAILCILVALLLPALKAARDEAQRVVCMSNLKQMHLGFYLYAEDYEDYLPIMWWGPTQDDFSKHWMFKIEPYIQKIRPGVWGGDVFKCPSAPQLPSSTYFTYTANLILGYRVAGYVPHHKKTSSFVEPSRLLLTFDGRFYGDPTWGGWYPVAVGDNDNLDHVGLYHRETTDVLYLSGTVSFESLITSALFHDEGVLGNY